MASASSAIKKELNSMIECPICVDLYCDPRTLPCMHSFCFKCIDGYLRTRPLPDVLSCPLCRQRFTVADAGADGLPKNFVIEQLVRLKSAAQGTCSVHLGKDLEISCRECRVLVCVTCYFEKHRTHECFDNFNVLSAFQSRITSEITSISRGIDVCCQTAEEVLRRKLQFARKIRFIDAEIDRQAFDLKQTIDEHKILVKNQLEAVNKETTEKLDALLQHLQNRKTALEQLKADSHLEAQTASVSDIVARNEKRAIQANDLHDFDSIYNAISEIMCFNIAFTPSDAISASGSNAVGILDVIDGTRSETGISKEQVPKMFAVTPTVIHQGTPLSGLTAIDCQLFAIRLPSQRQIEVYDSASLAFKRFLQVPCLSDDDSSCYDITSCSDGNCLYVSDSKTDSVVRIQLDNDDVQAWRVDGGSPTGIAVTSAGNVLVTIYKANKLLEFSPGGLLLRERIMPADVAGLWHAVQLASDQLVVSHLGPVYGISVISAISGELVSSYRNRRGNRPGLCGEYLRGPSRLSVVRGKYVLFADSGNNRIVVLNSTLTCAREIPLWTDTGLQEPWTIHLDETCRRLYVGECNGGRMLVFDRIEFDAMFE